MTARALTGLFLLNVFYLAVGSSLVWALRGWRSWAGYVRFAGLAYFVGVAFLGSAWTLLLVVGVPFGPATIVLTGVAVLLAGVVAGRRLGRTAPERGSLPTLTVLSFATAAGIAVAGVFLEALFRAGRLRPLVSFDAWAFWVPKGKALYEYGELDAGLIAALPNPSYPPLVTVVDAAAFHAMGSADPVTLHLQFWLFALGFAAAVAGLLWRRVPGWMLWPFLVLALLAPRASENLVVPQADFLLQFFFALAAGLGALWLLDRDGWSLALATMLLGAAALTKREGVLLAVLLLAALALAASDRRRDAWPRIAVAAVAVGAIALPWRLWYAAHDIGGEAPADPFADLGRIGDAARLAIDVLFDISLWSLSTYLLAAAVLLAAAWGSRRLAVLFGALLVSILLGGTWISVAYPELPITAEESLNPIVRYTAAATIVGAVATPLLLAGVWRRAER